MKKISSGLILGLYGLALLFIGLGFFNLLSWPLVLGLEGVVILCFIGLRFSAKQSFKAVQIERKDVSRFVDGLWKIIPKDHVVKIGHCSSRIFIDFNQPVEIDLAAIRQLGISGVLRPSETSLQLISKDLTPYLAKALNDK